MLNHDLIGVASDPVETQWDERDVMLYALAVGAGQRDPGDELAFTTENSDQFDLQVLPTFVNTLVGRKRVPLGDFSMTQLVHAGQSFTIHAPLPTSGRVEATATVSAIYDKVSAAIVVRDFDFTDADSKVHLATAHQSLFIRGEGGFGGDPGPRASDERPSGEPDFVLTAQTRPDQALLYRLTGDRNPLHSDPAFARRAGFDRPILHGMCTYGITGRLLLQALCGSDTRRFRGMDGRFSSPVLPGDELSVDIWHSAEGQATFRTRVGDRVVLDRGTVAFDSNDD